VTMGSPTYTVSAYPWKNPPVMVCGHDEPQETDGGPSAAVYIPDASLRFGSPDPRGAEQLLQSSRRSVDLAVGSTGTEVSVGLMQVVGRLSR
jgi:hypothetical protein